MNWVSKFIYQYVKDYIHPLLPEEINLANLYKGIINLKNIQLRPEIFDQYLDLPLSLVFQYIESIDINIPIWLFLKNPISIDIENALFVFNVKDVSEWGKEEWGKKYKENKNKCLENHTNQCINHYLNNSTLYRILIKLFGSVQVTINKIEIKIEDFYSNAACPLAVGVKINTLFLGNNSDYDIMMKKLNKSNKSKQALKTEINVKHTNFGKTEPGSKAKLDYLKTCLKKILLIYKLSIYCDELMFPEKFYIPFKGKKSNFHQCFIEHSTQEPTYLWSQLVIDNSYARYSSNEYVPYKFNSQNQLVIGSTYSTKSKKTSNDHFNVINSIQNYTTKSNYNLYKVENKYVKTDYNMNAKLPYKDIFWKYCNLFLYTSETQEYFQIDDRTFEMAIFKIYKNSREEMQKLSEWNRDNLANVLEYIDLLKFENNIRKNSKTQASVFLQVNLDEIDEFKKLLEKVYNGYHNYLVMDLVVNSEITVELIPKKREIDGQYIDENSDKYSSMEQLIEESLTIAPNVLLNSNVNVGIVNLSPIYCRNLIAFSQVFDNYAFYTQLITESLETKKLDFIEVYMYERAWLMKLVLTYNKITDYKEEIVQVMKYIEEIENASSLHYLLNIRKNYINYIIKLSSHSNTNASRWYNFYNYNASFTVGKNKLRTNYIFDIHENQLDKKMSQMHSTIINVLNDFDVTLNQFILTQQMKIMLKLNHFQLGMHLQNMNSVLFVAQNICVDLILFDQNEGQTINFSMDAVYVLNLHGVIALMEAKPLETIINDETNITNLKLEHLNELKRQYGTGRFTKRDLDNKLYQINDIDNKLTISNLIFFNAIIKVRYINMLNTVSCNIKIDEKKNNMLNTTFKINEHFSLHINIALMMSMLASFYELLEFIGKQDFLTLIRILHLFNITDIALAKRKSNLYYSYLYNKNNSINQIENNTDASTEVAQTLKINLLSKISFGLYLHLLDNYIAVQINSINYNENNILTISDITMMRRFRFNVNNSMMDHQQYANENKINSTKIKVEDSDPPQSENYVPSASFQSQSSSPKDYYDYCLVNKFSFMYAAELHEIVVEPITISVTQYDLVFFKYIIIEYNRYANVMNSINNILASSTDDARKKVFWTSKYFYILLQEKNNPSTIHKGKNDECSSDLSDIIMHSLCINNSKLDSNYSNTNFKSTFMQFTENSLNGSYHKQLNKLIIPYENEKIIEDKINFIIDCIFNEIDIINNEIQSKQTNNYFKSLFKNISISFYTIPELYQSVFESYKNNYDILLKNVNDSNLYIPNIDFNQLGFNDDKNMNSIDSNYSHSKIFSINFAKVEIGFDINFIQHLMNPLIIYSLNDSNNIKVNFTIQDLRIIDETNVTYYNLPCLYSSYKKSPYKNHIAYGLCVEKPKHNSYHEIYKHKLHITSNLFYLDYDIITNLINYFLDIIIYIPTNQHIDQTTFDNGNDEISSELNNYLGSFNPYSYSLSNVINQHSRYIVGKNLVEVVSTLNIVFEKLILVIPVEPKTHLNILEHANINNYETIATISNNHYNACHNKLQKLYINPINADFYPLCLVLNLSVSVHLDHYRYNKNTNTINNIESAIRYNKIYTVYRWVLMAYYNVSHLPLYKQWLIPSKFILILAVNDLEANYIRPVIKRFLMIPEFNLSSNYYKSNKDIINTSIISLTNFCITCHLDVPNELALYERYYGYSNRETKQFKSELNILHFDYDEKLTLEVEFVEPITLSLNENSIVYTLSLYSIITELMSYIINKYTNIIAIYEKTVMDLYRENLKAKREGTAVCKALSTYKNIANDQLDYYYLFLSYNDSEYLKWIVDYGTPPTLKLDDIIFNFLTKWSIFSLNLYVRYMEINLCANLCSFYLIELSSVIKLNAIPLPNTTSYWYEELNANYSAYSIASGLTMTNFSDENRSIESDSPYQVAHIESDGLFFIIIRAALLFGHYIRKSVKEHNQKNDKFIPEEYNDLANTTLSRENYDQIAVNAPWLDYCLYAELSSSILFEPFKLSITSKKDNPYIQLSSLIDVSWINIQISAVLIKNIVEMLKKITQNFFFELFNKHKITAYELDYNLKSYMYKKYVPTFINLQSIKLKNFEGSIPVSTYYYVQLGNNLGETYRKLDFNIYVILYNKLKLLNSYFNDTISFNVLQNIHNNVTHLTLYEIPNILSNNQLKTLENTSLCILYTSFLQVKSSLIVNNHYQINSNEYQTIQAKSISNIVLELTTNEKNLKIQLKPLLKFISMFYGYNKNTTFETKVLSFSNNITISNQKIKLLFDSYIQMTDSPFALLQINVSTAIALCLWHLEGIHNIEINIDNIKQEVLLPKNLKLKYSKSAVFTDAKTGSDDVKADSKIGQLFDYLSIEDSNTYDNSHQINNNTSTNETLYPLSLNALVSDEMKIYYKEQLVLMSEQFSFFNYLIDQAYANPVYEHLEELLQELNPLQYKYYSVWFTFVTNHDFTYITLLCVLSPLFIIKNRLPYTLKLSLYKRFDIDHTKEDSFTSNEATGDQSKLIITKQFSKIKARYNKTQTVNIPKGSDYGYDHNIELVRWQYNEYYSDINYLPLEEDELILYNMKVYNNKTLSVDKNDNIEAPMQYYIKFTINVSQIVPNLSLNDLTILQSKNYIVSIVVYAKYWIVNNLPFNLYIKSTEIFMVPTKKILVLNANVNGAKVGLRKFNTRNSPSYDISRAKHKNFVLKQKNIFNRLFNQDYSLSRNYIQTNIISNRIFIPASERNASYTLVVYKQRCKPPFFKTISFICLPAYVFFNKTNECIYIEECNKTGKVGTFLSLPPLSQAEFHPERNSKKLMVRISSIANVVKKHQQKKDMQNHGSKTQNLLNKKRNIDQTYWSAPIEILTTMTRQIRYPTSYTPRHAISPFNLLELNISFNRGVRYVSFFPAKTPEYKLVNLTPFTICYGQTEYGGPFEALKPYDLLSKNVLSNSVETIEDLNLALISSASIISNTSFYDYDCKATNFCFYDFNLPSKLDVWLVDYCDQVIAGRNEIKHTIKEKTNKIINTEEDSVIGYDDHINAINGMDEKSSANVKFIDNNKTYVSNYKFENTNNFDYSATLENNNYYTSIDFKTNKALIKSWNELRQVYSRTINLKYHYDKMGRTKNGLNTRSIQKILVLPYKLKFNIPILIELKTISGVRWIIFKPYIIENLDLIQNKNEKKLDLIANLNKLWLNCNSANNNYKLRKSLDELINFYLLNDSVLKPELLKILQFGKPELVTLFLNKYKKITGGIQFSKTLDTSLFLNNFKSKIDDCIQLNNDNIGATNDVQHNNTLGKSQQTQESNVDYTMYINIHVEGVGIEFSLFKTGFLYCSFTNIITNITMNKEIIKYAFKLYDMQFDTFITNDSIIRNFDKANNEASISIELHQKLYNPVLDITLLKVYASPLSISIAYENLITVLKFIDIIINSTSTKKTLQQQINESISDCYMNLYDSELLSIKHIKKVNLQNVFLSDFRIILNISTEKNAFNSGLHIIQNEFKLFLELNDSRALIKNTTYISNEVDLQEDQSSSNKVSILHKDQSYNNLNSSLIINGENKSSSITIPQTILLNYAELEKSTTYAKKQVQSGKKLQIFVMSTELTKSILDAIIVQTTLSDAMIYLPSQVFTNLSGPIDNVLNEIYNCYISKIIRQSANVLGALDLLGNPALSLRSIISGISLAMNIIKTQFWTKLSNAMIQVPKALTKGFAIGLFICISRLTTSWANIFFRLCQISSDLSITNQFKLSNNKKEYCSCCNINNKNTKNNKCSRVKTVLYQNFQPDFRTNSNNIWQGCKIGIEELFSILIVNFIDIFVKIKRGIQLAIESKIVLHLYRGFIGAAMSLLCATPAAICKLLAYLSTGSLHSILEMQKVPHTRYLRYISPHQTKYDPYVSYWYSLAQMPLQLAVLFSIDSSHPIVVNAQNADFVIPFTAKQFRHNTDVYAALVITKTIMIYVDLYSVIWTIPIRKVQRISFINFASNEYGIMLDVNDNFNSFYIITKSHQDSLLLYFGLIKLYNII